MYSLLWQCFDHARTKETGGDCNLILDNSVSVSVRTSSNDRIIVEEIARQSQTPVPTASLPDVLSHLREIFQASAHGRERFRAVDAEQLSFGLAFLQRHQEFSVALRHFTDDFGNQLLSRAAQTSGDDG
jgi:hypothetical protein